MLEAFDKAHEDIESSVREFNDSMYKTAAAGVAAVGDGVGAAAGWIVNMGSKAHSITATWSDLGWGEDVSAAVRDLWQHADLPNATKSFTAKVPSHGTAMVRLSRSAV